MQYTQEDARKIALNCAQQYKQKLLNKNLLVIYRERRDNSIRYLEIGFFKRNYLHLTGLEFLDSSGKVAEGRSENFYQLCADKKLSVKDFRFKADGTTPLKLSALPALMDVAKITKIVGDYNNARPYLVVDKVVGGVNFCLGLTRNHGIYIPSSALWTDIRSLTDSSSQVLAVMEKGKNEQLYSTVKGVAKGLNLSRLTLPDDLCNILALKNYVFKGK